MELLHGDSSRLVKSLFHRKRCNSDKINVAIQQELENILKQEPDIVQHKNSAVEAELSDKNIDKMESTVDQQIRIISLMKYNSVVVYSKLTFITHYRNKMGKAYYCLALHQLNPLYYI